jgi:cytochrome b subunit of formate dehydrogenase
LSSTRDISRARRSNLLTRLFLIVGALAGASTASARDINPRTCVECHDALNRKAFEASVHGGLSCTDCHVSGPFAEHEAAPPPVQCGKCHEDEAKDYEKSIHGLARRKGIKDAPTCVDCHGGAHSIGTSDSPKAEHARQNIPGMCARCHADLKIVKKYSIPIGNPYELYKNGVHGKALAAGNLKAAVCSDCHGSHTIQPGHEMASKTAKGHMPATCGRCHPQIMEDYNASVHGQAVAQGITDAPACSDCHGEHGIVQADSPESPVSATQVASKTCGHCHQDLMLAQRYGFAAARLSTFMESYHGLAVRRGSLTVANCSSCHGVHKILASTHPNSSINPANLPKTCGSCHPGATAAFTRTPVHLDTSPTSAPVLFYARQIYLWMIFATIGLMLAHNLFIYVSAVADKIRKTRAGKQYDRFSTIQLAMHGLLFLSFTALVVTGFGLKFPESGWTNVLRWLHINEEVRRIIHRVAACVMLGAGFAHVFHSIFTKKGRHEIRELLPRLSDVREIREYLTYYLKLLFGRHAPHPHLGRYTYIHKAEYWALIWGTVVMSVTGLGLWFPEIVSRWLPSWGIPLFELVHYYEAWLATLAILVWHFFFVVFHPAEYPMSTIWITGKVSDEEMKREHPRELEEMEREHPRELETLEKPPEPK